MAIRELSKLVEGNFLNREYYEAVAYTDEAMRYYANYNKKHQVLLITGDPQSGWSCGYSGANRFSVTLGESASFWVEWVWMYPHYSHLDSQFAAKKSLRKLYISDC